MRCGINFFPTVRASEKPADQFYDECLLLSELADELGYDSIRIVEHYFFAYGGYSPDPVTFLAAASQRTSRVRLVTGAVIPAFTHPVKLAGKLAMLDNLSHGRLDVGFARAFLPDEFEAFQVSIDESRPRFDEAVDAIKRLWSETDVRVDGKFHQFGPVTMLPRPYQQPHPPVWIACTSSAESFQRAGELGHFIMIVPYLAPRESTQELLALYRRSWAEAGHEPGAERIQMSYHAYVAEDGDTARREGREYFEDYVNKMIEAVSAWDRTATDQYRGYESMVASVKAKTFDVALSETKMLVGTPAEVLEQLRLVMSWYGDVEPSLQVNFGNMPLERARRTMQLFADEVLPAFETVGSVQ